MFDTIERLHKMGFIYTQISPSSFRISQSKVYLMPCGSITPYLKDGVHVKPDFVQDLPSSNLYYLSCRQHEYCSPSRADDLESLGYVVLTLLNQDIVLADASPHKRHMNQRCYYEKKKLLEMPPEREDVKAIHNYIIEC